MGATLFDEPRAWQVAHANLTQQLANISGCDVKVGVQLPHQYVAGVVSTVSTVNNASAAAGGWCHRVKGGWRHRVKGGWRRHRVRGGWRRHRVRGGWHHRVGAGMPPAETINQGIPAVPLKLSVTDTTP